MRLFEALEELSSADGFLGETVSSVLEGICECGYGIADALEGFTEKLGEAETALAGEDGEASCWEADRLDPEWDSDPKLKVIRDAVDSIVNFCNKTEIAINNATAKVLEMTERALN